MDIVYLIMAVWLFLGWVGSGILSNKVSPDKGTDLGKVISIIGLGPIALLASFLAKRNY